MAQKIAGLVSALVALMTMIGPARADVIVTLEAFTATGQPVAGPVTPGAGVTVDVLLSVDAADNPLADVRMIQFDFAATSPGIQLVSYTWSVDANAYSFQDAEFPVTNVTSILFGSGPGLLALTTEPVKVGSVDITVDTSGTLDTVNPENTDENFGGDIRASFTANRIFRLNLGNLQGGTLAFSVTGDAGDGGAPGGAPQPNDQDGDGVTDVVDAFPANPDEAIDTNNDGVGNNADPDDDGDGVVDVEDAFPIDPAETSDTDGNGVGDNEDSDRDGDNVANDGDAFPDDPAEAMDTDDDGIGNNADTDDDGDGIADAEDAFPLDPNQGGVEEGNTATGSPVQMCGAGMLGSSLLMLMGLGLMSYRPHRRF